MLYEDKLNDYFDSLKQKYKISDTFININEKISIFINIVAFIGITAAAYFFKLSIFKYLICIVIGFIALDILGMLTDKILIGTIFIFSNIKNKLKTLFMSLKFNKLSRDKQLKLISSTEKKREEIINSKKIYSKEEIEKIDEELKFYRENLKEIQKVDEQIEDAITRRYNNDIDKIKEVIMIINTEKEKYPNKIKSKFNKIQKTSEELLLMCETNPVISAKLTRIYNIYILELIDTLRIYIDLDEEDKTTNKEKMYMLFDKIQESLDSIKDEVKLSSKEKFELNANLLLDVLDSKEKEG